jgi:putative solute:sodium symporter small subunit
VQDTFERAHPPKQRRLRFPILALAAWAFFTLLVPRLVEQLNIVDVLAFPLGFFMSAQGSLLTLLAVAILSARHHDKLAARGDE